MTNKALLIIDMQKESHFGLINMETVTNNNKRMIEACREQGIPVIFTRQINRSDRAGLSKGEPLTKEGKPYYYQGDTDQIEILDELAPLDDEIVIDKYRWSAFFETSLDLMLKSLNVEELLVGGVVTDGCLMTSVFDAYFRDYKVNLITDMTTASNEGAHQSATLTMANWVYTLEITRTEQMLKRLRGEPYESWTHQNTDDFHFTGETLSSEFNRLTG